MISANIPKNIRRAVYRRDGFRCALCDSNRGLQIHHVIHRSQGGKWQTAEPHYPLHVLPQRGPRHQVPGVPGVHDAGGNPRGLH